LDLGRLKKQEDRENQDETGGACRQHRYLVRMSEETDQKEDVDNLRMDLIGIG
jgi:hypothetical protein